MVVTQSPQFSHSVPLLKSLHWLPVQSRNIFKLCTIAYQTLSSGEPSYLFSMLYLTLKPRELRSSSFQLLSVLSVKSLAETRAFSVVVPTLRNSLSEHVKSSNSIVSFHHHLKTHLFRLVYPFHLIIVDELCIIPGLWVCPIPPLGAPLSSILFEDIGAIEVL